MPTDAPTNQKGTLIDGLFSVEGPDSSGEILDVKGADLYSFETGDAPANWEHRNPDSNGASALDVVGRIVYAKKIYDESDCENERQKEFYHKFNLPCIYGIIRLADAAGHPGAQAIAALMRDAAANNEPCLARYSVEGSTLKRDGNKLTKTVLRGVAITVKPCNKASVSGLLSDPQAPKGFDTNPEKVPEKSWIDQLVDNTDKSEASDPMFQQLGHKVEMHITSFSDLQKMLEAGNYNVPPSSLVGGSALSVEHIKRKPLTKEELTQVVKGIIRDWNKTDDIIKILKHKLPEASDGFINRFAELANSWKFKKSEEEVATLRKFESLVVDLTSALRKATEPNWEHTDINPVDFKGQRIWPGAASVPNHETGNFDDYLVLHQNPEHIVAIPEKSYPHYSPKDLVRIPKGQFTIHRPPKPVSKEVKLSAVHHGDPHLNQTKEQHDLIHDTDMLQSELYPPKTADTESKFANVSHWRKMGNGKVAYIKPDIEGQAKNEVRYHNLAKNFFGLGHYIPTSAYFTHPQTGEGHAAIEYTPGEHVEMHWNPELERDAPKGWHAKNLLDLGNSGELDKMALMNRILGNTDRHSFNYLMSNDHPGIKLIDHGYAFSNNDDLQRWNMIPDYLDKYSNLHGTRASHEPVHGTAAKWVKLLDPDMLHQQAIDQGVSPKDASELKDRLIRAQQHLSNTPLTTRQQLYKKMVE